MSTSEVCVQTSRGPFYGLVAAELGLVVMLLPSFGYWELIRGSTSNLVSFLVLIAFQIGGIGVMLRWPRRAEGTSDGHLRFYGAMGVSDIQASEIAILRHNRRGLAVVLPSRTFRVAMSKEAAEEVASWLAAKNPKTRIDFSIGG